MKDNREIDWKSCKQGSELTSEPGLAVRDELLAERELDGGVVLDIVLPHKVLDVLLQVREVLARLGRVARTQTFAGAERLKL